MPAAPSYGGRPAYNLVAALAAVATLTGLVTTAQNDATSAAAAAAAAQATAAAAMPRSGGAFSGSVTASAGVTIDGVDVGARDAVLTSTTTTANAALPKAGGQMVGNITFSGLQTVDGVDLSVRDGVLSSTTSLAQAALPVSGGTMYGAIAMNNNKLTGLAAGTVAGDSVRLEQAGSDARAIKVRSFSLSLAQMQAKGGATNATWTMLTLNTNEFLQWGWMENAGATCTSSVALTGVWTEVGRAASPGTLIIQTDLITAGTVTDDNSRHGADFVDSAVMGNKLTASYGGDATTYFHKSQTINVKVTLSGGSTMAQLTACGPLYFHLQIGKVDTTQLEAVQ